jgi:putative tricarboxylic transport membrane protein
MNRESWGSLIWLGAGIVICIGAFRLSLGSMNNPGPGMFPFLAGAILAMLASILLFQSLRSKEAPAQGDAFFIGAGGTKKAGLILLALFAYSLSMEYLGFILGTALFLAFLLAVVEPQRWYIVVFGSIAASLLAYTIFKVAFDTPLPVGLYGY